MLQLIESKAYNIQIQYSDQGCRSTMKEDEKGNVYMYETGDKMRGNDKPDHVHGRDPRDL